MIDWEKVKPKTAIHYSSREELHLILQEFEKASVRTSGGRSATHMEDDTWCVCKDGCIGFNDYTIGYCSSNWYLDNGYTILEFNDACKPDLPRLCYLVGGEKTPLQLGECFGIKDYPGRVYKIHGDNSYSCTFENKTDKRSSWYEIVLAIIHPEKVIRRQQFSDDEKALMRELVKAKLPWAVREADNNLFSFSQKPPISKGYVDTPAEDDDSTCAGLPNQFFPQITPENSPFDCEAYLKSHE